MSKESKFHKLIEQQDCKRKEQVWERLKDQIEINTPSETVCENGNTVAVSPKRFFIPIISAAAVLLCAVVLILIFTLKPAAPSDGTRYCAESDYNIVDADMTLQEYAAENNLDILCFDWNEDTDSYSAEITKLIKDGEIICFTEKITDEETGCPVRLSVTDNKTQVEFLKKFATNCNDLYQVNEIAVKWCDTRDESIATFEYKSYVYYISVIDPIEEEAVLSWVNKLIQG